jgi:hypothetical protein
MIQMKTLLTLIAAFLLFSCKDNASKNPVATPGEEKSSQSKALETGAALLQHAGPLKKISTYLNGFHFYNGNIGAQMEAHHYVSQLNEDVYQAIIYDGNTEDARIMGVEYIISERLFKTLPAEEKKLWHSHHHEVKSGSLVAPGIPDVAEHELMEKIVSTYGKTIHTWHTDQQRDLPVGSPMLMMGFTKDGQLNDSLVKKRDQVFGISTAEKKENRQDIPSPTIHPGANSWEKGDVRQFVVTNRADSAMVKHPMKH